MKATSNLAVCAFVFAVLVLGCKSATPTQTEKPRVVDPAKREQHRAYLEELKEKGIFAKIDDQGGAHSFVDVWTGPRFYEATFEQKEIFVGAVWSYYFGDTDKRDASGVRVFDNYSGKEIGEYSVSNGGLKLY